LVEYGTKILLGCLDIVLKGPTGTYIYFFLNRRKQIEAKIFVCFEFRCMIWSMYGIIVLQDACV
jgi:hypothetical protein